VIAAGPEKSGAIEPPAPQVVTPAPETLAPKTPEARTPRFSVQIISTTAKSEAARWKDRLSKKGFHVSVVRVDTSKGERFRVRVGPYPDREKANRALAQLAADEHVKGWIVPAE
jgi:DedD protein